MIEESKQYIATTHTIELVKQIMKQEQKTPTPNYQFKPSLIWRGLLFSIPFFSLLTGSSVLAQINPCPGIFYEEPHNNRVLVPQGCPPNAFTAKQQASTIPASPETQPIQPIDSSQPPLPETTQTPIATVTVQNSKVNVQLVNSTGVGISYQAIGQTATRTLNPKEEFVLRNLTTPITITLVRQDSGFLKVIPTELSPGTLTLSLVESAEFGDNQGAIRINANGQVFFN